MKTNSESLLKVGILGVAAYVLLRQKTTTGAAGIGAVPVNAVVAKRSHSVIAAQVKRLASRLGDVITKAAILTGSPAWAITGIAANEISDFPYNAVNKHVYAAGVMQQSPGSVLATIKFARKYEFFSPELETFFRQKVGAIHYPGLLKSSDITRGDPRFFQIVTYLQDPEFCVMVGALMIRVLIHMLTDGGQRPLNQSALATCYNHGTDWTFVKLSKLKIATPSELVAMQRSEEGRIYIPNVAGAGGYFERAKAFFGVV